MTLGAIGIRRAVSTYNFDTEPRFPVEANPLRKREYEAKGGSGKVNMMISLWTLFDKIDTDSFISLACCTAQITKHGLTHNTKKRIFTGHLSEGTTVVPSKDYLKNRLATIARQGLFALMANRLGEEVVHAKDYMELLLNYTDKPVPL